MATSRWVPAVWFLFFAATCFATNYNAFPAKANFSVPANVQLIPTGKGSHLTSGYYWQLGLVVQSNTSLQDIAFESGAFPTPGSVMTALTSGTTFTAVGSVANVPFFNFTGCGHAGCVSGSGLDTGCHYSLASNTAN